MKNCVLTTIAVSLISVAPMAAFAASPLSEAELMVLPAVVAKCGDRVVASAKYTDETYKEVAVTCKDAEGFVPLVGALGIGGAGAAAAAGLALVAAAGGGGGSTPDTQ